MAVFRRPSSREADRRRCLLLLLERCRSWACRASCFAAAAYLGDSGYDLPRLLTPYRLLMQRRRHPRILVSAGVVALVVLAQVYGPHVRRAAVQVVIESRRRRQADRLALFPRAGHQLVAGLLRYVHALTLLDLDAACGRGYVPPADAALVAVRGGAVPPGDDRLAGLHQPGAEAIVVRVVAILDLFNVRDLAREAPRRSRCGLWDGVPRQRVVRAPASPVRRACRASSPSPRPLGAAG